MKIDPKLIGVGQYQHDMNQKKLSEASSAVVEDCVNKVGVDLNTASAPLLSYISGYFFRGCEEYRGVSGKKRRRFRVRRKQLLKVAKAGPKAFEQCAGFMRILEPERIRLDATSVHPWGILCCGRKLFLKKQGFAAEDIQGGKLTGLSLTIKDHKGLAEELGVGEYYSLRNIVKELEKPGA